MTGVESPDLSPSTLIATPKRAGPDGRTTLGSMTDPELRIAIAHGDPMALSIYVHDGHRHARHGDHYDEH